MNLDLPTPGQVLKGIADMLKAILFALVLLLAFSPFAQVVIAVGGMLLVAFHHWIIGGLAIGLALVGWSIRKSL